MRLEGGGKTVNGRSGLHLGGFATWYSEDGLGGGSQLEALAGVELSWRPLTLKLIGVLRYKEYDEYLGKAAQG